MPVMTGLSGNEIYCLHLKGMTPGDLVIGNSVFSMGFLGGIGVGFRGMIGGEEQAVSFVVVFGRVAWDKRLLSEGWEGWGVWVTEGSNVRRHLQGRWGVLSLG